MAKGKKYGAKGESGTDKGASNSTSPAHKNSANTMGGASTPHVQEWNGYGTGKTRDADIKKSGGSMDY